MKSGFRWWVPVASVACALIAPATDAVAGPHDALITKHAAAHGVPESLVRRIIHIESKGNARVVSKGNYGLMQIRLGTAKAMGYRGTAEGLLDPDTNMTYAVKYLALAYRAAGCSESGAVGYYQRGFYKKPRGRCAAPRDATTQIAKVDAPAEVLKPRVVQVQTITRPKAVAQSAVAQPVAAPVQVAAAPAAASAPTAVVAPAAVQPPPAPQTVAKAPEQDASAAPQTSPAIPTVFMELLPMPRPRPATAPKVVAKLDVAAVSEPSSKSDASAVPPDLQIMKPEPAAAPMPKPRPARAPQAVARRDAAASDASPASDAAKAASPEVQIAKLDPAAVPLPQPKPVLDVAQPEEEAKPARRKARHARVARKQPQQQESALVTFWRNLTTPQPARRRR